MCKFSYNVQYQSKQPGSNNVHYTTAWFRHFLPQHERKMCTTPFKNISVPFLFVPFHFMLFHSSPKAEKARFAAAVRALRQLRAKRESVSEAIPCRVALSPSSATVSGRWHKYLRRTVYSFCGTFLL